MPRTISFDELPARLVWERIVGETAAIARAYLESLDARPVVQAEVSAASLVEALGGPLPEEPSDPVDVVRTLAEAAGPGIVASAGGRYFGFVNGSTLPAALGADWLTTAWDQNAGLYASGLAAGAVEEVCTRWLAELLGLPAHVSMGFVTGCQAAHVTALAAARHHVLARTGWDVARDGLFGAPRIAVLAGERRHMTVDRALRLLGMGDACVTAIEADGRGRMRPDALRAALGDVTGPAIVVAQAGEVNTGSFDPFPEIADAAKEAGAWLHVDGAFGLWAAASPSLRQLVDGVERADSWATDGHKWLNVPYDSGIAICAHPDAHRTAMAFGAAYLLTGSEPGERDGAAFVPEASRRAHGFPIWAAVRQLGRSGVADLVDRCCAHARRFADGIAGLGAEVLNEVVLNQVLFRFETDARTDEILARVQRGGEAWLGGTTWDGRRALRLSVSSWVTGEDDVDRALSAFRSALRS